MADKKSKAAVAAVAGITAASLVVGSGFAVILSALAAAVAGALLFPVEEECV